MNFIVRIDRDRCKGCELCIPACPVAILKMTGDLSQSTNHFAEVLDEGRCTGCQQCAQICPDAAIEIYSTDEEAAGRNSFQEEDS